jgi:hypothetical protein
MPATRAIDPAQPRAALLHARACRSAQRSAVRPVHRARTSPAPARVRQSERAAARRVHAVPRACGTHAALRKACAVCVIFGGGGAERLRPRAARWVGAASRACEAVTPADKRGCSATAHARSSREFRGKLKGARWGGPQTNKGVGCGRAGGVHPVRAPSYKFSLSLLGRLLLRQPASGGAP